MSMFEYEPTAENIMAWLDEGGYSCVLYLGKHRAYVTDDDDDYGWQRIPVVVARQLLTDGNIAVWDVGTDDELARRIYVRYRPARWVAGWNMGQRPWFSTQRNQLILNVHQVDEALKAEAGEP